MSERGSFVTEYIYCDKCLEACKRVLLANEKYLRGIIIPGWEGLKEDLPIIAGKIGGLYGGEELHTFEWYLIPELQKTICHPLRIAVLAEDGEQIFRIDPTPQDGG